MDLGVLLNDINAFKSNNKLNYNFGITISSGDQFVGNNISKYTESSNAAQPMDSRNGGIFDKKIIIEPILSTQENYLYLAHLPKRTKFENDGLISSEMPTSVLNMRNNQEYPVLIQNQYGAYDKNVNSTLLYAKPSVIDDSIFKPTWNRNNEPAIPTVQNSIFKQTVNETINNTKQTLNETPSNNETTPQNSTFEQTLSETSEIGIQESISAPMPPPPPPPPSNTLPPPPSNAPPPPPSPIPELFTSKTVTVEKNTVSKTIVAQNASDELFAAIRKRPTLRSIADNVRPPPILTGKNNTIGQILKHRVAVMGSDSDTDSDDDLNSNNWD